MSMSIPAFHVSDASEVKGRGDVFIASRASAPASGVFSLEVSAKFAPPADDYPSGGFTLKVDLNDGLRTDLHADLNRADELLRAS